MKRLFDIFIALLALTVLTPLYVVTIIGIRLSSQGPIFFRARRVGRGGEPFEMFKFRTMHIHSGGPVITSRGDRRIFAFGFFLRKAKIDELPQFWNVLKGDLSVVGPRPEDPKIVEEHYTDWMMETLVVRPGITSLGAVYYYISGEHLVDPEDPERSYVEKLLLAKLAVERAYLERATFASDLWVIVLTSMAVIGIKVQPDARDLAAAARWDPSAFRAIE